MGRFNTLCFQVTPDGPAGMAPDGGLTPTGLDTGMAPEPDPVSDGPSVEDQLEELQRVIAEQQQMLEQVAPVAEYMQGAPGPQADQTPQMPTDPFEPNYAQQMQEYLDYRDQQRLGPYQEVMQAQKREQAEGLALDMIHDVIQSKGELLTPRYEEGQSGMTPDQMILQIAANVYYPQTSQQYGDGTRADEAAIEAAYEDVKLYQEALLAASDQRQTNQMQALRSAPREPGSSGVAAQPAVTTVAGGWEAFKARHGLE